jgi:Uma2 family endonuclease
MANRPTLDAPPSNLAELLDQLGGVPLERILARPAPGTATEKDAIALLQAPNKRLVELVQGVLIEKPMATSESNVAARLLVLIGVYLLEHDLGTLLTSDGAVRLMPGLIRVPDMSFISWDKLPGKKIPKAPVASLVPDLAAEVISKKNTKREMQRKLRDYFLAGVRLVWLIYPKTRTAEAYTSPEDVRQIGKDQLLDGGTVIPGYRLPLARIFEHIE